jgi:hypothetical protein
MANSADLHSPACQQNILNLMLAPVKSYASLFTVLALPSYLPLLHAQSYPTRRSVAAVVIQNILKNQTKISIPEHADGVFNLTRVLIHEGAQPPAQYPGVAPRRGGRELETDETMEEQGLLARMVHLLYSENNDTQFKVFARILTRYYITMLTPRSFYKPPKRPLTKEEREFVTQPPHSSPSLLSLHVDTRLGNTSTMSGLLCPLHFTSLCTRVFRLFTSG